MPLSPYAGIADQSTRVHTINGWTEAAEFEKSIALAVDKFSNNEFDALIVQNVRDNSLEFLRHFAGLERLSLLNWRKLDPRHLYPLSDLKRLVFGDSGVKKIPIDLTHFPKLESLSIQWHKKTCGLSTLSQLKELAIWGLGKENEDPGDLGIPDSVSHLMFVRPGFNTTQGLEKLPSLSELILAWCRNLYNLQYLGACKGLQTLELECLPRAAGYDALSGCTALKGLSFANCAPIPTLSWLKSLTELNHLGITGTKILDGNLSPVQSLPSLTSFGCTDSPGYKPRAKDIELAINVSKSVKAPFCTSDLKIEIFGRTLRPSYDHESHLYEYELCDICIGVTGDTPAAIRDQASAELRSAVDFMKEHIAELIRLGEIESARHHENVLAEITNSPEGQ